MDERLVAALLTLVATLAIFAKATRVAYPIVFVLAGVALALVPGMPNVRLDPALVFFIFLPPLLFGDGWTTDFRQFKRYVVPIATLATGPVIVTTLAVAWVAHAVLGVPYAVGATLGAILAPTDAVATDAIAEDVGLPRRLGTILGGESLVNDATGLVLYKFAVAAVVTGTFSLPVALLQFVYVAVGGIAVGIGGGWLIARAMAALRRSGLIDPVIAVTISLVTPFALYVPADAVGVSGVLAAVAGGIFMSRKNTEIFDADSRIAAASVWNLLFFTFNGTLFILLGLQLRSILGSLAAHPPLDLALYGAAITLTVIAVRFAWIFPVSWLRWRFDPGVVQREGERPPRIYTAVISWAGMRGIVSLAAALALPERTADGAPFPGRDLVLFTTFVVILATLLAQGLTLGWLIRRANALTGGDRGGSDDDDAAVARARVELAGAGLARLNELEPRFDTPTHWEVAGRLRAEYEQQRDHYRTHQDGVDPAEDGRLHAIYAELQRDVLAAIRGRLDDLRRAGEIPETIYRDLQNDIDLGESRLG